MPALRHHGWPVSPYSAKTRSTLRFKGIDIEDDIPTARQLRTRIQRAVGRMVMPTVELPDGTWLQDSSDIIDELEAGEPGVARIGRFSGDPAGAVPPMVNPFASVGFRDVLAATAGEAETDDTVRPDPGGIS